MWGLGVSGFRVVMSHVESRTKKSKDVELSKAVVVSERPFLFVPFESALLKVRKVRTRDHWHGRIKYSQRLRHGTPLLVHRASLLSKSFGKTLPKPRGCGKVCPSLSRLRTPNQKATHKRSPTESYKEAEQLV